MAAMTSLAASYEPSRPQTHQGLHASPHPSPRIQRPASQAGYHVANVAYSPNLDQGPMSAYPGNHPQPFRSFTPTNLSLPLPHQNYGTAYPSTAPPVPFYPEPTPLWDARASQPMIRTVSHGHLMHSATDHTASSRYSSSPHSATNEVPPSAGGGFSGINPAVFNPSYLMSRSTSGASDAQEYNTRLLTPHAEYRALGHAAEPYGMHDVEMRKMSDSLNRMPSNRFYSQSFNFDHVGPHPQPDMGRAWGNEFAMSAERGGQKLGGGNDTDYEREREQQIINNKKLIEDMGLGGGGGAFGRSRSVTGGGVRDRSRTPIKKRLSSAEVVRSSPRIASIHRSSYANLDGDAVEEESDEYNSGDEPEIDDEDEFRPVKKPKGTSRGYGRKASYNSKGARKADLSLWGLLEVYSEIPRSYPLFYYTLNNDLSINSDSVPLIGSIPSTATGMEKAGTLQSFFHRGRRVLSQLDAFTSRCDRKYDGAQEKLMELDFNTRIAIRDVRRKVVERCENYKYTRRDILDKTVGKNKWQPIENDLVDWKPGMTQNDPAGDLANVTLTLPTPPPSAMYKHGRQYADRQIRPFPRSRVASVVPHSARTVSVTMAEPDSYPVSTPAITYSFSAGEAPPPMYGEDEVPMSVRLTMPVEPNGSTSSPLPAIMPNQAQGGPTSGSVVSSGLPPVPEWQEPASSTSRGVKRSHSDDEEDENDDDNEPTQLWQ